MRAVGRCRDRSPRGDFARGRQKGGLKEAFDAEVIAEIEEFVGPGAIDGLDFEAIETAARRRALSVAARAIERRLNADTSDHSGPVMPCDCGKAAHYAGRRPKTFTTALGEMTLERAYYHCELCQRGFCPRDLALGIKDTSLSPAVTRMVGLAAAMVSFEESDELLGELAGVAVGAKQVERTAEALGREIAEDERRVVDPMAEVEPPPTLYLGLDGTGVPMRASEIEGNSGKQEDGSAKTREVKLCVVWSAEGRDEEGVPVRDEGSVSYSAAIESAASRDTDETPPPFAQRAIRETTRRSFSRATRRVVLGDGAPWIWNIATEHFPDALQIVDRYHANEHLSDAAKAIYGPGSDLGKQWAHSRCTELKAGDIDAVLAALAVHSNCEEAQNCSDYIQTNRERMRYAEFHAAGLCTSTGVLESGCKRAIGVRLKRGGMFWTVQGADAIIALRCSKLSGRFQDFWERRSTPATATTAIVG